MMFLFPSEYPKMSPVLINELVENLLVEAQGKSAADIPDCLTVLVLESRALQMF